MPVCIARAFHYTPRHISITKISILPKVFSQKYTTKESQSLQHDLLNYLRRTVDFIPNVLSSSDASIWRTLIGSSIDTLQNPTAHPRRVAVWGSDELSQPTALVSALLDDPLISDKRIIHALRNRRAEHTDNVLTIRYGELSESTGILTLGLPMLQKLGVDIVEIPATHPDFKNLLYDADVRIITSSVLSDPLPRGLESLLLHPMSFMVFCHPISDQRAIDLTIPRLGIRSQALSDKLKTKIFQVYPPMALSAIDTFRGASNSTAAIESFQSDFLNSGVTVLSQSISHAFTRDQNILAVPHAQLVLSGALEASRNNVEDAFRDISAVQLHIDNIRDLLDRANSRATETLGGVVASEIADALFKSTKEMEVTMDALKWWKLPFKVDDLSDILTRAAERGWCRELEAKLQFQTGLLSALQSTLTMETYAILDRLPARFQSAVLVNTLHQISTRPPVLSPTTMTQPLAYRLQQLQFPILSLHQRAQRALLAVGATIFATASGAYAAWFLKAITLPTALGLTALGVTAGVRLLVGKWEKGRKLWWKDWRRVGQGLEKDLKETSAMVIRQKVTAVPSMAAEKLSKNLAEYTVDIKNTSAALENLEQCSRPLYARERTSTK